MFKELKLHYLTCKLCEIDSTRYKRSLITLIAIALMFVSTFQHFLAPGVFLVAFFSCSLPTYTDNFIYNASLNIPVNFQ